MKKIEFLILPLVASVACLTACGEQPINQGPELRGVSDKTCLVNTELDLLDGVAALDTEDGDITPDLQIKITPEIAVNDGRAVFGEAGEYEICYEVRDSLGKLARTTAAVEVVEREVYKNDVCTNGFNLETGGSTSIVSEGLTGDKYSFKAVGNEISEDIKLSRTYSMAAGVEYKFTYFVDSSAAGRIKVAADETVVAEMNIAAGECEIVFSHKTPYRPVADGEVPTDTVDIALWLGGLEGDGELSFSLSRATLDYYMPDTGITEKLKDFNFNGKIINRDDRADAVYASEDGKSATVKIENPTGEIWQVGMFVNTGVQLNAGETYYISFDMASRLGNDYQVCIQHDQWNDGDAEIIDNPVGAVERMITATDSWSGWLWLYIRSGVNKNELTISDLSVKSQGGGDRQESYDLKNFSANNGDTAVTEYGKVTYKVKNFGDDWGNNELGSPAFELSGDSSNYVISFKAKASQNLNCVFAATEEAQWNTFCWKNFNLTSEETTYFFRCDEKAIDGRYKLVWQFGNAANKEFQDVTIEISEIKICLVSELEK